MVRRTLTLALVFLTCVYAAPAQGAITTARPKVPGNKRVTLIRNSTFGFALAAGDSKSHGVLEGNKEIDINLPGNAEEKAPDVVLLENVNSGAGIALGGSLSFGVIKDNILAGKNPFWKKK